MPHVMVPFANGKGGVGKTSLACSFAVASAREGADVLLADLNEEQRSAHAWMQVRNHNALLPNIRVEVMSVREALEQVGRCDVLVVDTPGWADRSTFVLAQRATYMVVPTGPNPTYELHPTLRLLNALVDQGIAPSKLGIVLSKINNESEESLARSYLGEVNYRALDGVIRNDPAYGMALAQGYGLTEVPDKKALQKEATDMMKQISTRVREAERKNQRSSVANRDRDRSRERES